MLLGGLLGGGRLARAKEPRLTSLRPTARVGSDVSAGHALRVRAARHPGARCAEAVAAPGPRCLRRRRRRCA
jgi:hypothetical protein